MGGEFPHERKTRITARKQTVAGFLTGRDYDGLREWAASARNPFRTLYSLLWAPEAQNCWRAAEAIGLAAGDTAAAKSDTVREVIRRLFWSMNDESGNLCWYAGQALGEILARVNRFRDDYLSNYLSFVDEEPFEVGTRYGIMRLGTLDDLSADHRSMLEQQLPKLRASLSHADPAIRAYSILAIRALQSTVDSAQAKRIQNDGATFAYFDRDSGILSDRPVAASLDL
jgi:hypothetical protein